VTQQSMNEHLRAHYEACCLPEEMADGLAESARRCCGETGSGPAFAPRSLIRLMYALAACLAVAVMGNMYLTYSVREAWERVAMLQESSFFRLDAPEAPEAPRPQLVAMRTVMANCPSCPLVQPVFEELERKHADDPRVLFMTYDITNEQTRRESEKIASALGIKWMMPKCCESGTIQLADCGSRTILSKLVSKDQKPELESALAVALSKSRP